MRGYVSKIIKVLTYEGSDTTGNLMVLLLRDTHRMHYKMAAWSVILALLGVGIRFVKYKAYLAVL